MPRPISYAVFCLKKKNYRARQGGTVQPARGQPGSAGNVAGPALPGGWHRVGGECRRPLPRLVPQGQPCAAAFLFNDTPPTEISTLSLHDALPIYTLSLLNRSSDLFFTFWLVVAC